MHQDDANTDRPERRTALVARELGRYDIDMTLISLACVK